jgi:hypothetical protein
VIELRLFDPARHPTSWTDIIQPGQFAAFSKRADSGGSCDHRGQPFASVEMATCLMFDALEPARSFCAEQVLRVPDVRFEIFDSAGRADGPLLVIVHPARTASMEGNPRGVRIRAWTAAALVAGSLPLFWYDYQHDRGMLIFPTALGVNLIIVAARLLQLNGSYAHAARERQRRLDAHIRAESNRGAVTRRL